MTLFGWIIVSIVSVVVVVFGVRFTSDIIWNRKLGKFQKSQSVVVPKIPRLYWVKRSYGLILSSLVLVTTVASGAFAIPNMLDGRVLLNATPVGSKDRLEQLIADTSSGNWWSDFFNGGMMEDEVLAPEVDTAAGDATTRDYIGTNVQVEGVDEADIVKTDGYTIYYATRYYNEVRILDINDDGTVDPQANLDLGDMYTDALYLTDTQLIVIGYVYTSIPYTYQDGVDYYGWAYTSYSGAVYVYNRETMELEYKLETDSNFYQHRLVTDPISGKSALYLVSSKSLYTDELRPEYSETQDGNTVTSYLGYDSIFYFDDVPVYSMTVVTGISLDTYEMTSQAFLGNVSEIYASTDAIYTVDNYSSYTLNTWESHVQIVKYALDVDHASITYVGQKELTGYVGDQYWMDEYDGYFRIVTSSWNPIHNDLYILEEDDETDELNLVGSITDGLGNLNESVKSVRFDGDTGYVVTFEQHDPLYTIDLSDPNHPVITSAIEEPGYSTYLHIWDDDNHVIGFGFSADDNGFATGLKISAYDTTQELPLEDYQLNNQDEEGVYSYSYSEASYNPKALMVSPDKGIIAFPIMSWRSTQVSTYEWEYDYVSQYLVFYIDFSADQIISDPIVISHNPSAYYVGIDRGVYINNIIYTLSYNELVSFDLDSKSILETIVFQTYFDENPGLIYVD
ncbi:MAG: beta-propeller domain-containing protein [Firmicutes bacterium]|nr:beta-propeller domain-containing protein [Bacillota bacterium]